MKFRVKIVICMIWLLSLALGIGGSLLISNSFDNAYDRELNSAVSSFRNAQRILSYIDEAGGKSAPYDVLKQMELSGVMNADAVNAYFDDDTVLDSYGGIDDNSRDIVSDTVSVYSNSSDKKYLRVAGDIVNSYVNFKLVAYYDITPIYLTRASQYVIYNKIFVVTIIIGTALSYAMAYLLTRPLDSLKSATKKLAEGDMDYRAVVKTKDEFGALSNDFNAMADKLEENINELQDSMKRQEEFMGSFAHEMKTPMTSIIGYADLLRSQSLDADEQMNAANYIFSEGKRLESLSFKLLDLIVTKNGEPDMKEVNPAQLISQLAESMKPIYLKQNITLQYKCEDFACLMDADLIRSLLVNLLDNARKALSDGGNIYLTSKLVDGMCEIKVLDNGPGIPEESLAHLTEAFYRVDKSRSRAQGGAGLGLNLCNEIVKLHNGEMRIESRVDNGTSVTVLLNGGAV